MKCDVVLRREELLKIAPPLVAISSLGEHAGCGCFASSDAIEGDIMALYPGVVVPKALVSTVLHFLPLHNGYLISRGDGYLIDADTSNDASRALLRSAMNRRMGRTIPQQQQQQQPQQLQHELGGGIAVGHLVNHSVLCANVRAVDVVYEKDCDELIPVAMFGAPTTDRMPGVALVATRHIAKGEELFLNYAFTSDPAGWPQWYSNSQ